MFRFSGVVVTVKNRILNVRLLKIIEEIQLKFFVESAYIYVFIHSFIITHVVFYMCDIYL